MQVTQERNGWSQVPHWLLIAVKPAAVVVYAQLAAYAWMPDGARPAVKRVADELGISESTVERALRELADAGAVVIERRYADPEEKQQLPSRYHLRLVKSAPPGVTHDATPGVTSEPTLASPVTPEVEEEKEEGVKNTSRARQHPTHDEVTADFVIFWERYPRRVAKGQALKAYRQARKKIDADSIIKAVTKYPFDRERPQFIPYPATWLNGERWNDENAVNSAGEHMSTPSRWDAARLYG